MSKEKGDVKGEVVEKDKDLKSTKSVNDGNDSKSCVVESSNPKSTKEKISVYSLCVPIYTRNFVSKDIFSSHITLVKNGLKDFSYLPKMKNNRHTSYFMMSEIMDGFNIVFYSQTHKHAQDFTSVTGYQGNIEERYGCYIQWSLSAWWW